VPRIAFNANPIIISSGRRKAIMAGAKVSRRSGRLFDEEHDNSQESRNCEIRRDMYNSGATVDERENRNREREMTERGSRSSTNSVERPLIDLGKDLGDMFPKTVENVGEKGTFLLLFNVHKWGAQI
jgi:hypothetical protein